VGPTGSDSNSGSISSPFASLAHASEAAHPGDSVFARGGIYYPTQTQYLGADGTAAAPITFSAYPGETPVIDGSHDPTTGYAHIFDIGGQYLIFEGFTVQNSHFAGIQSWGGRHLQILNNIIHDCQDEGITIGTNDSLTATTDVLVAGNVAFRNDLANNGSSWASAIATSGASNVRFLHNVIYDNMGEGLNLLLSDGCIAAGNIIHDNFSVNLYLDNTSNAVVKKNLIYSMFAPTYFRDGAPAAGIQVANESYSWSNPDRNDTIINNIIKDGNGNFFYGNYGRGGGLVNFIIANNDFYQASTYANLFIDSGSGNPAHHSALIANNIFYQSGSTPQTKFNGSPTGVTFEDNNWYGGASGQVAGTGDVLANPLFVTPGGDIGASYKLLTGSPDLGQGVPLTAVTDDYFSKPRPVSAPPSIGAYTPPSSAPLSANQQFVANVYQSLLGRQVDDTGLSYWSDLLDGGLWRSQVVSAIEASQEYESDEVQALYERILDRPADSSGLGGWVGLLAHGGTAEQVEAQLLGSTEYIARHGSSATGFLQGLYEKVLGRAIDPAGLQGWSQVLGTGAPRSAVADAIVTSLESDGDVIEVIYSRYLHRPADSVGLQSFLGEMQQGATGAVVSATILSSDEYFVEA
jgi:hypothetical protein